MRKANDSSFDHVPEPRPRRSRAAWVVVFGLLISPLVYDGAILCVARWQALFGPVPAIETPTLDALNAIVEATASAIRLRSSAAFRNVPWSPSYVLGLAAVWVVIGCRILMRRR